MANAKNEAKIKFTAETSEFTSAIQSANSEMSTLRAEMRLAEASFKNTGDAAEYQKNKTEILEAQLQANADKQEALTQKLEAAKAIYGEDSEEVAKLERALINAQTEEQRLTSELNDTNSGLDQQKTAADEAGSSVDAMAEILVNAGIADKLAEIGQAAYDMAAEFDDASAAIVEGTGASGDALDGLNESAQNAFGALANSDGSINAVANTLAELNTRFGLTGDAAEDATVKFENFADHTGTDGVKAVDSIADVMHRWGMDINDLDLLLDDLTTANQSCQMSVDDLSGYLASNSTQFQELGYSSEEALAMLISLSDGGADVSSVMSGLTKGVANLSSETDDVPGAFQAAIEAIENSGSVSEALQQQVGDTGKTVEEVFGKKAAQELATNIQNGSFAIDGWTSALQNNDGALQSTTENATTMSDSWQQAVNNVQMALMSTFAPAIQSVVTAVSGVVTQVAQVVQQSPMAQAMIVGIATALGILATALGISALITVVTKAFALLNTTMLANPVFLVVTAIAALVAGLIYAWNNCEAFRNIVTAVFETIRTFVVNAITIVQTKVTEIFTKIRTTITNVVTAIRSKIVSIWTNIKNSTSNIWNNIKSGIQNAISGARNVVTSITTAIRSKVTSIWNGIKSATSTAWNFIRTAITNPISTARSMVSSAVSSIKSTFSSGFNAAKTTVSNIFTAIKTKIKSIMDSAKNVVSNAIEKIKSKFKFSWSLPKLKLPHIKIEGKFSLNPPSVPHFSIDWHRLGVIFNKATLIPTINGIHGVGEAGPEAVSPISTLQDYVGQSVRENTPTIDYDRIATSVARACAGMDIRMELNHRELGRVVREVV